MSEEKLDSNVNDTPKENSAAPEQQEKSFDDNVEIIDYDIDDKITVKDFDNNERKPAKEKEPFDLKAEIISWIKMIIAAAVIVTSPQELVQMIVEKAVRMANLMNVKVAGIVENMSYLECPDCGKRIAVFGESKVAETAEKYGLDAYAQIPVNPEIAKLCDAGKIEELDKNWLENIVKKLEA